MSRTWWGLLTVAAIVTAGDLAVTAYVYSWFVRVSPNDNPGDVGIAIALYVMTLATTTAAGLLQLGALLRWRPLVIGGALVAAGPWLLLGAFLALA